MWHNRARLGSNGSKQGRAGQGTGQRALDQSRAGQGRAGQGRAGQGRATGQRALHHSSAGWGHADQTMQGRAGQGGAGQGMAGHGRACIARKGAMTDLGLLLSLQRVTVHLLLQVALGVLVDLDQINLLVGRVLSLSLELVQ